MYKVHLPIMLVRASGSIYRERKESSKRWGAAESVADLSLFFQTVVRGFVWSIHHFTFAGCWWDVSIKATQVGSRRENNLSWWFANNKGADQPAHSRSLISAFVIRFLESIIYRLATNKISVFYLVSVDDETGLSLPEDKFCRDEAQLCFFCILSRSKSLLPDNSFKCLISTQFLSHCFVNITKKAIYLVSF